MESIDRVHGFRHTIRLARLSSISPSHHCPALEQQMFTYTQWSIIYICCRGIPAYSVIIV
ncbi:hypothetical protein BaRGS_00030610, partial [Batillaria attramentaria]